MLTSADIKAAARQAGFDLVGIAPAVTPTGFHAFLQWLRDGYAGGMEYLSRREEAYAHPGAIMDGVRSLVLLGINYRSAEPTAPAETGGRVSRYAWSGTDYHDLLRGRLKQLAVDVEQAAPGTRTRGVVDTAPLLERDFARLAGLGWFGKNTMLLNKQRGSWFFLAALLTDVDLEPDPTHFAAHCGTCTRCLDACPTDAFVEPYVLDARRCISYLTIEHKGPIPRELREGVGQWLFGCDVCQEVCPWNRKAPPTSDPLFYPRPDLEPLDAAGLLQLSPEAFRARFRHTPLSRPKRAGLLRNAAIVLGNSGSQSAVPILATALADDEPQVRGASAWALGRLGGAEAREALIARRVVESDPEVGDEIALSLEKL